MITDAYPWLAGTLLFALVLAFGGDYDKQMSNSWQHSCALAHCGQPLRLGGWPATLP